jgi:amidohydrolase
MEPRVTIVPDDVGAEIDRQAAAVEEKVIDWRHRIYQNPELSNREEETAKLVAEHLNGLGLDEVGTGVARHGVIGVLRGAADGLVMGLRADIDALPIEELQDLPYRSTKVDHNYPGGPFPVGHMCGHDAHTAMLMGAAEVLANMLNELPGTVKFLFQPAEDGGAKMMVKQGALADRKPDMIFVLHTGPIPDGYLADAAGHALA